MSDIPTFSPLVHAYTDALRVLRDHDGPMEVAAWAKATGRVLSNVKRDAEKLAEAGVVVEVDRIVGLTALGNRFLAGQDLAQGLTQPPTLDAPAAGDVVALRHEEIIPDPDNARRDWDSNEARLELDALRADILEHGLLQNLVVRINDGPLAPDVFEGEGPTVGGFVLVGGERRWRAIGLALAEGDWPPERTIACRLIDVDALGRRLAALSENLQRRNLNPLEKAQAFEGLAQAFADQGIEPEKINRTISDRIGTTIEHVQQHRSFMKLDPADQTRLALPKDDPKRLSVRDARAKVTQKTAKEEAWKPTDQTREEQLVLAEMAYTAREKSTYLGSSFSVGAASRANPVALRLAEMNIIDLPDALGQWGDEAGHYQASFRGWTMADAVRAAWPGLGEGDLDTRRAALRAVQVELTGAAPPEGRTFLTDWLEGPFDLTDEGRAIVEERRQADETRRREDQERAAARDAQLARWAEARTRHLAILNAAADKAEAGSAEDNQAIAADLDRPLPWRIVGENIVAANEQTVRRIGNYHGQSTAQEMALAQMTVVAVNAAGGQTTPPPAVEEALEPLEEAEFIREMAEVLLGCERETSEEEAADQAAKILAEFLEQNGVAYGEDGFDWTTEGADTLADAWVAENWEAEDAEEAA